MTIELDPSAAHRGKNHVLEAQSSLLAGSKAAATYSQAPPKTLKTPPEVVSSSEDEGAGLTSVVHYDNKAILFYSTLSFSQPPCGVTTHDHSDKEPAFPSHLVQTHTVPGKISD